MMNYYERIQQAIDYIEDHLRDGIELQHAVALGKHSGYTQMNHLK